MQIHISSDGVPIYQQIVDQLRHRIISGSLRAGDELPTIRGFATSLRVNPNTIARAYRELEHEGLVEKRRTTGTFVAEITPRHGLRERKRLVTPHVDKLLVISRGLGIEIGELIDLIQNRNQKLSATGEGS